MRRCRPLLGTYVEIEGDRGTAIGVGFAAIAGVHAVLGAHDPNSDIGRINRFGHMEPVEVDDWTMLLLEKAFGWSKRSGGVFDVVRAGRSAIRRGLLPKHPDQPEPEATQWTWLEVEGRTARLLRAGCLDVGGIAKGFAVDQARAAMRRAGASRGLINAGGDIFGFGAGTWPIDIVHPLTRQPMVEVQLRNEAIATSGLHPDASGHHLRAGAGWISDTVRAPTACDADALTKIVWANPTNLRDILDGCAAAAFAVRTDGAVHDFGQDCLAA